MTNVKTRMIRLGVLVGGLLLALSPALRAEQVYEAPAAFIERVFDGAPPAPSALWMTAEMRDRVKDLLGHELGRLRVRYWARDDRSAWVLEEIGKEEPITAGIVVEDGAIASVDVLVFRESRGWEVRYPFFTDQFRRARLEDGDLDRRIDGITGATLSVRAVEGVARVALYLHEQALGPASPLDVARTP